MGWWTECIGSAAGLAPRTAGPCQWTNTDGRYPFPRGLGLGGQAMLVNDGASHCPLWGWDWGHPSLPGFLGCTKSQGIATGQTWRTSWKRLCGKLRNSWLRRG